tara:strand:- start:477 stop:1790 length:1314 start_codon:yes stop_codon:yes gene_type:complete
MKIAFTTLGCRTNQHDTAEMQTLLKKDGFQVVGQTELADIYIVNTCTVTSKSDYRSRLAVKKSLGLNKDALVVFTGCYAQTQPEEAKRLPGLGLILGNSNKHDIVHAIKIALSKGKNTSPEIYMSDIEKAREFKPLAVEEFQGKTKAFIKVQTGCDETCSFCTVVKARGRSISDSRSNILNNVKKAISSGFREITLSGINLGTWGLDFQSREAFSSLVDNILNLPGDFRVRLSSINPMEIDMRLIRLIADHQGLCPHLHIPLQSGDDKILKSMRRNYNSDQYRRIVDTAAELIPGLGLGADVIVGFPGETDSQFENTRRMIESLPFSYLHVFSYSPRPGTEAFSSKNEIPNVTKKERNRVLMDLIQEKAQKFHQSFIGKTVDVLVENQREGESGFLKGHSQHYIPIVFSGGNELINKIVPVFVDRISERRVFGCSSL